MQEFMVDIGQALARAREEKDLTLEKIAEETRINLKYLQDLEQGKFDFLPRPYVVAYLKTLASRIGLDGEALVQQWRDHEAAIAAAQLAEAGESIQDAAPLPVVEMPPRPTTSAPARYSAPPPPPAALPPQGIPYLKEVALGLGVVLVMAAWLYFSTRPPKQEETSPPQPVEEIPFDQVAREAASRQDTASPVVALEESAPAPKPMRLEVRAAETVWVQVIADQRDSSEFTLRPGNTHAWQALEQFYVRLGNAGVVKLLLDGNDLGVIGGRGQVGSLIIAHDGIKRRRLVGVSPPPAAVIDSTAGNQ